MGLSVSHLWERVVKGRLASAVLWSSLAHFGGQFIRIGTSLVLTRLLAPDMFGLMALVIGIQVILALLSDFGVRVTIIQSSRGDDPALLNTAWSISILRGLAQWLVCLAIAGLLYFLGGMKLLGSETAWSAPELPALLAATSFSAVIMGFQSTNIHSASRWLQLGGQVKVDIVSQVIGAFVGVVLAALSGSIWALVSISLIGSLANVVLSHIWLPGIRNRIAWDRTAARELLGNGVWIAFASTVHVIASTVDRFVLGMFTTAATLGLYSLAINLVTLLDGIWGRILSTVALPRLSEAARLNDLAELRRLLVFARVSLDLPLMVAAGALFALSPTMISLMYDARYHEAGYMAQILSLSVVLGRYGIFTTAYLALGKPKYLVIVNTVKLVSLAISLPVAQVNWGIEGALFAIALHGLACVPVTFYLNARHGLNNWWAEIGLLAGWPIGYACGLFIDQSIGRW